MQAERKYTAKEVMKRAANDNRLPRASLFKKLLLLSLLVAPIVIWLLWFR